MIYFITGATGAGKTLYALTFVQEKFKGRRIVQNGVNGLKLDWETLEDVKDWHKQPEGTVIVIDEAWRHFPARTNGSAVPEHIGAFATHRHLGIDIVLITQHPTQIDIFIRKLIESPNVHFHVRRTFGLNQAVVHEFPQLRANPETSCKDSTRHVFKYPKTTMALYESSSMHTGQRRIPHRLYFLAASPILLGALLWIAYSSIMNSANADTKTEQAHQVDGQLQKTLFAAPESKADKQVATLESYVPRIEGVLSSAPRYDSVNIPAQAPKPSMCVMSATKCQCYTIQATRYPASDKLCRQIATNGYFDDTLPLQTNQQSPQLIAPPYAAVPAGVPGAGQGPVDLTRVES